ncbi:MAG: 2-polyprenyl-3-methyl-5-hydroxy-6-metoxy-1,4-benzoquinol methylase [Methylophilaceae bacterium]|jgi:2-polyprenyl-3-methyl-5-hydroxy-6-metoxy-1,4-benzoquinol methylase
MKSKRHNYEYDVDVESNTAPANVVRMVGQNKSALEIGCGPGSITKILAEQSGCKVIGLELDPDAIEKVAPYCVKVMQADLNSSEWPRLLDNTDKFDVVVAADVLEHLYDPWASLQRMVPLIKPDGCIVISLPHIGHAAVMSCLFNGDFEYRNWGLLDRTHIRFFCLKNIEELFAQANLKIIEVAYVTKPPEETEFATTWGKLSSAVKAALKSSPYSDIYQVVVKAVPVERSEKGLLLTLENHTRNKVGCLTSIKRRLGARISPDVKVHIRKVLNIFGLKL